MTGFDLAVSAAREGILVLVVGPSGAGKDTLISAARAALAADPRFTFVRRTVTRAAATDAEDHETKSPDEFRACAEGGGFALTWAAHGLFYGLPRGVIDELRAGGIVVANVSRGVVGEARALPGRIVVVHITARSDILARRLAARGREAPEDVTSRIGRAAPDLPADTVEIRNNGTIEAASGTFVALLRHLAEVSSERMPP